MRAISTFHQVTAFFLAAVAAVMLLSLPWWYLALLFLLYSAIVFSGVYFIRLNFFIRSRNHGSRNHKRVAITFDDGPDSTLTAQLLAVLKEHQVPATFFVIGKNIAGKENLLREIAEQGHLVGNHSYDHGFWFSIASPEAITEEIKKCNAAVAAVIGCEPQFFRPPYGVTNPRVAEGIQMAAVTSIGWSLRSYDTMHQTPEALLAAVKKKLKNGDVLLFHDTLEVTIAAMPEIIRYLRAQDVEVVSLDALLGQPAYRL
ncbi:MAG: polysaccharide deacetylase family protein [Chitinophagales bacterium]